MLIMNSDDKILLKKPRRRSVENKKTWIKQERNALVKKVSTILQKSENERTQEEIGVLLGCTEVTKEVKKRLHRQKQLKSRLEEVEDPPDVLEEKCRILASAISQAQHLVCYTGAGISTAACIPDYRGPNGVWTLLQQGKDVGNHDLSLAEPTQTHMALSKLHSLGTLKHVVSQNCDGLHIRSGLPRTSLSEVHGNMYLEVCRSCNKEYLRLFDVTEKTARFNHRTGRLCHSCGEPLRDTIVHFGERGSLQWPLNWSATTSAARKADVIICLGSSLKVLKKYPWLWCMDRPIKNRPLLYIVNLQWTPKDDHAALKINGRCDDVFERVMKHLNIKIPNYDRSQDPIFSHATPLHPSEIKTTTRPMLQLYEEELLANDTTIKVENYAQEIKYELEEENSSNPLDLTIKSSNDTTNSNKFIDLTAFPWFTLQYFITSNLRIEHNYCRFNSTFEELNMLNSTTATTTTTTTTENIQCNFCYKKFYSSNCMIYKQQELTDKAILSSESSEEENEEDSNDSKPVKNFNPGWFGKGYKKPKFTKKKKNYTT